MRAQQDLCFGGFSLGNQLQNLAMLFIGGIDPIFFEEVEAAHDAGSDLALPLRDRAFHSFALVEASTFRALRPMIDKVCHAWAGTTCAAAFRASRGAGMSWARVRAIQGALEANTWLRRALLARQRALHAWRTTLDASDERELAYSVEVDRVMTPDIELDALRVLLRAGAAATQAAVAAATTAAGGARPEWCTAWMQDYREGHAAGDALVAVAQACLAQERLSPLRAYLNMADAVFVGMLRYTEEAEAQLRTRVAWQTAMCLQLGDAAGDAAVLLASTPPLLARLRLTQDGRLGASSEPLAVMLPAHEAHADAAAQVMLTAA